jgi:hypothetical protein
MGARNKWAAARAATGTGASSSPRVRFTHHPSSDNEIEIGRRQFTADFRGACGLSLAHDLLHRLAWTIRRWCTLTSSNARHGRPDCFNEIAVSEAQLAAAGHRIEPAVQ